MLEFIILGFLMFGATSGYDLKRWMTRTTSYFFDASFGSIYPALKRLTLKKRVVFHEVVEGGKYKKVYEITETGKKAFLEWLEEPIVFDKAKHDHMVKIFFYEFLPNAMAIKSLKNFVCQVELVADQLKNQKKSVENEHDVNQFYCRYQTIHYGTEYYNYLIRWCHELIDDLKNIPNTEGGRH